MPSAQSRRRLVIIADQAASSLSNVVVAVLVARSFPDSTEQFAAFSMAIMTFQFTVGCVRGFVFEPALSLYPTRASEVRRRLLPGYLGAALAVGVSAAAAIALIGVAVGGLVGAALLALAAVLPLVLLQDAWRYIFLVDRPEAGLAIDVLWLAASCAAIVLVPQNSPVGWYVIAWGGGGVLGAVAATAWGRAMPALASAPSYVRAHRELAWRFLVEFVTAQAAFYLALLSCSAIVGLDGYGAVRAGYLFMGPLMTLQAGLLLSLLPEGVGLRSHPDRLHRLALGSSVVMLGATAAWTVVGLLLPDDVGTALFGPTWYSTEDILAFIGLTMVATGFISGALVGVRSIDGTRGIGARLRSIPFQVVCPLVGAAVGGTAGFTMGLALGQVSAAVLWWATFARVRRSLSVAPAEPVPSPSPVP